MAETASNHYQGRFASARAPRVLAPLRAASRRASESHHRAGWWLLPPGCTEPVAKIGLDGKSYLPPAPRPESQPAEVWQV